MENSNLTGISFGLEDTVVEQADVTRRSQWNEYVGRHPRASAYHWFEWMEAIQHAYSHSLYPLIALQKRDGITKVCGVLPLVLLETPVIGRRFCSLPFCDLGGPVADNYEVERQLINAAAELLASKNARELELRSGAQDALEDETAAYYIANADTQQAPKVQMLLKLPATSELLWDGFKSKLRSQVRKAEKNGLSVTHGQNPELLEHFYQVLARNMRDLGSPVHSVRLYESLLEKFSEKLEIHVVYKESLPIAAGLVLRHPQRVSIPWASTVAEFNSLSPNMMLYWSVLKSAADGDFKLFDFGRSTIGEGTYRFKKQWGAEPYMLQWQSITDADQSAEVRSHNDRRHRPKARESKLRSGLKNTVVACWQKLPLPVASAIGPLLRKHISL